MYQSSQWNGNRPGGISSSNDPPAVLALVPLNGTFDRKQINVPYFPEVLRIGRQTNAKTVPTPVNGYFDSKVLSRQHAEIWADRNGKIWIRDVKSSNGTFVNGTRLSPESRDSEPHELRENDTLELGIDIVSEDQKSIVHHKVSAKVEHAGIYGANTILDLNFADIDPTSGGGLLPSPLSQPLSHLRGRSSSSLSNRSSQSAAGNQINALHQQRQMNYWLSPISIEQVVKRLSSEMKQARQQAQDLRQTDEFLHTLAVQENSDKEKSSKIAATENSASRQMNGRPKMSRIDSISRFSDPPAPPPQQPLPEKPDAPHRTGQESMPHVSLKRSDTEKQPKIAGNSPVSRESSQILSLIEALTSTRKELDAQGARVKELEDMLRQERSAREHAEERARKLEQQPEEDCPKSEVEAAFEPPSDGDDKGVTETLESEISDVDGGEKFPDTTCDKDSLTIVDPQDKQLQLRLDAVLAEMEDVKQQIEHFKNRAEQAEDETREARMSLAKMIESLRCDREVIQSKSKKHKDGHSHVASTLDSHGSISQDTTSKAIDSIVQPHHAITPIHVKEMENASTAFATQWHRHNLLQQSTPYASMLGVVLLGVGLMAYLNGWQRIDKSLS